jgi:hypothetical protein
MDDWAAKRLAELEAAAPKKRTRHKNFAVVPLNDDWGYRAVTAAGHGAAIVLYALYKRRTGGVLEVPITTVVLKRCGISRKTRTRAINKLVKLGFATARHRGNKFRGCPLLTLLLP